MKKVKFQDLISMEEIDKEIGWTPEQLARIEKGALKIIERMELKRKREKQKLTQAALAKKAGLPRSTIARLESKKAKVNPTIDNLKKIANALDMELEFKFVPKK